MNKENVKRVDAVDGNCMGTGHRVSDEYNVTAGQSSGSNGSNGSNGSVSTGPNDPNGGVGQSVVNSRSVNVGHSVGGGHSVGTIGSEDNLMKVKNCDEMMSGDDIYRMGSNPRGFCLIFNVFEFSNSDYNKRYGSEAEAKRLAEVFQMLHFLVVVKDNPNGKEIQMTVEEYTQKNELRGHDAIVVIALSHGSEYGFIASDGILIPFIEFINRFNNKNCPNLIHKPKLFFVCCCRRDITDFGVDTIPAKEGLHINDNSLPSVFDLQMSTEVRDIMVCYSTIDGYGSGKDISKCYCLGRTLSQTLIKYSHNTELIRILQIVSKKIYERDWNQTNCNQEVIISLKSFIKQLYFNTGYLTPKSGSRDSSTGLDEKPVKYEQQFVVNEFRLMKENEEKSLPNIKITSNKSKSNLQNTTVQSNEPMADVSANDCEMDISN